MDIDGSGYTYRGRGGPFFVPSIYHGAQLLNERQTRLVKIHVVFYKQNNTHTIYIILQFLKEGTVSILTALNYWTSVKLDLYYVLSSNFWGGKILVHTIIVNYTPSISEKGFLPQFSITGWRSFIYWARKWVKEIWLLKTSIFYNYFLNARCSFLDHKLALNIWTSVISRLIIFKTRSIKIRLSEGRLIFDHQKMENLQLYF